MTALDGTKTGRYVVVTPVRDEARYVAETVASMACQTVTPTEWMVVDDGSTDGTAEILDRCANQIDWMRVIHRPDRGRRASGGGVVEAFNAGLAALSSPHWDFIVKLDGDLSFEPDYFRRCFFKFREDPELGVGGGTVCRLEAGEPRVDSTGDPPFHVRGATKIYRRECWDVIAPLTQAPGWDTIDEVTANFHGWTTRTFKDILLIQHKPTGRADGMWKNAFKNGRANYITGYHPAFMLAKTMRRAFRSRPFFVESTALLAGFCSGYIKRVPQMSDEAVIRYLRQQQVRRMLLRPSIYT